MQKNFWWTDGRFAKDKPSPGTDKACHPRKTPRMYRPGSRPFLTIELAKQDHIQPARVMRVKNGRMLARFTEVEDSSARSQICGQEWRVDAVTYPPYERLFLQRCVMTERESDGLSSLDQTDVAAKSADAAVRHALVEGRQQILNFLRRRLGNHEAAEDVLQTFMLRAIDRSEQLRDVRAVRGWLNQILASSIADYGRKVSRQRQREVVMSPTDLDGVHATFDEELDEAICNCLYKLLPTLKPEYAEVIWRVDLQEQPREDAARDLGITLNNINVRLHRGRQALKVRLQQMCLTCPVHGFLDCNCDGEEKVRAHREAPAEESENQKSARREPPT